MKDIADMLDDVKFEIEEIKEETEHIIRVYEDSEGVSHIKIEGR